VYDTLQQLSHTLVSTKKLVQYLAIYGNLVLGHPLQPPVGFVDQLNHYQEGDGPSYCYAILILEFTPSYRTLLDAVAADMPPNEEQRAFIDFMEGAALLHAPVGTGKTRSLADRAAAAIQRGVPADRILCLTFTNRAAQELRDRVTARCGQAGRHIMVRTFHSLCAWLLRQEYERVGLPPDFVIYGEQDAEDLLRYLMSTRFRDRPGAITHPGELYRNIQRAKADLAAQCPLRLGELRERVAGTFPAPLHDLILEYENELLAQR